MNGEQGDALPVGARIKEQYQVEKILGIGGFGISYLARDTVLDYRIAVKEYFPGKLAVRNPDNTVSPSSAMTEQQFNWGLDSFIKEARTLARFKHSNIVRVYNFFQVNDTAYMVMEYEEGENLASYLARRGALDEAGVRKVLFPILEGLELLHANNVIHRDIKPSNIFLRTDGVPLLLDFGSARCLNSSRDLTVVVSPRYSPPEQFDTQERQGPWTDIYALGLVLYTVISDNAPIDTSQRIGAVRRKRPDPLIPASEVGKGRYSASFLRAIDWAMSFERRDRPQSIQEWRRQLEAVPARAVAPVGDPVDSGLPTRLVRTDSDQPGGVTEGLARVKSGRTALGPKSEEEKGRVARWLRQLFRIRPAARPVVRARGQVRPVSRVVTATTPEFTESHALQASAASAGAEEEGAGEAQAIVPRSTDIPVPPMDTQLAYSTETSRTSGQVLSGPLPSQPPVPTDSAASGAGGQKPPSTAIPEGEWQDRQSGPQGQPASEQNGIGGIWRSSTSSESAGSTGQQTPDVFGAHWSSERHRARDNPFRTSILAGVTGKVSDPEWESNRAAKIWSRPSSRRSSNANGGRDLGVFGAGRRTNRQRTADDIFADHWRSISPQFGGIGDIPPPESEIRIEAPHEEEPEATGVAAILAEAADHIRRGNTLYSFGGQEREAMEEWEKAIAMDPEDHDLQKKIERLKRALEGPATIPPDRDSEGSDKEGRD